MTSLKLLPCSFGVGLMNVTVKKPLAIAVTLLTTWLLVAGCSTQPTNTPTWPQGLNVTVMSDGGICFDEQSAARLSDFKTQLESW
jgi:hypothetical protein